MPMRGLMKQSRAGLLVLARTALIAALGVAAFSIAGLPLPFLLGPMFACLTAALAGVAMRPPPVMGDLARTVLGVAIGASITPELVARLPQMALSVALVPLFVVLIGLIGVPYFRRVCRFDPATSYFAAMPGGFQDMLAFGEEAGADVRALSLIHATRVLAIVSVAPLILALGYGLSLDRPVGAPASEVPPLQIALMALLAVGGWRLARRIGLFGAAILGPMILATAASLSGAITMRPPAEAILAAQFFIGLSVGTKYAGVTMRELRVDVLASLGFCVILAVVSVAFAEGVARLGLAPPVDALLAFAPGGQAEMVVLALVAGTDVAFVVAHHLVRIVTVILGAPIARRFMP